MAYENLLRKTLWAVKCMCGGHYEWERNPPQEKRCRCGKRLIPKAETYISQDFKKRQLR